MGVLRDVGQGLAGDEVRRQLHLFGQALRALEGHRGRDARARGQRIERGLETVVEHRGMDPARELTQLLQRPGELVAGRLDRLDHLRVALDAALDHAQLERHGHQALLGPVVEVALEPPPLRVARSDETLARGAQLAEPLTGLRLQPRVVERDRRRGRDGLHELRIVVERRVVDEHPQLASVALDRRDRRSPPGAGTSHGLSAAVEVGALARHAVRQHEAGIAEHPGQARPRAARRAASRARGRDPRAPRAPAGSAAGPRPTRPGP